MALLYQNNGGGYDPGGKHKSLNFHITLTFARLDGRWQVDIKVTQVPSVLRYS